MLEMRRKGRTVFAVLMLVVLSAFAVVAPATAFAKGQSAHHGGGEASLALPDLGSVTFVGGINGHTLLLFVRSAKVVHGYPPPTAGPGTPSIGSATSKERKFVREKIIHYIRAGYPTHHFIAEHAAYLARGWAWIADASQEPCVS